MVVLNVTEEAVREAPDRLVLPGCAPPKTLSDAGLVIFEKHSVRPAFDILLRGGVTAKGDGQNDEKER